VRRIVPRCPLLNLSAPLRPRRDAPSLLLCAACRSPLAHQALDACDQCLCARATGGCFYLRKRSASKLSPAVCQEVQAFLAALASSLIEKATRPSFFARMKEQRIAVLTYQNTREKFGRSRNLELTR